MDVDTMNEEYAFALIIMGACIAFGTAVYLSPENIVCENATEYINVPYVKYYNYHSEDEFLAALASGQHCYKTTIWWNNDVYAEFDDWDYISKIDIWGEKNWTVRRIRCEEQTSEIKTIQTEVCKKWFGW